MNVLKSVFYVTDYPDTIQAYIRLALQAYFQVQALQIITFHQGGWYNGNAYTVRIGIISNINACIECIMYIHLIPRF